MGIQCGSSNKGVAALAYSALSILDDIIPGEAEFILFTSETQQALDFMKRDLGIANKRIFSVPFSNRNISSLINLYYNIKKCDFIIDFTGGDSFSDIYGSRRLLTNLFTKQVVIASKKPLIHGPQTYGPYYNKKIHLWIKYVINHSEFIFLRDEKSRPILEKMTKRTLHVSTDVAFYLPWEPDMYKLGENRNKKVGINISGLLWNGGYTYNNQFNLKTDYQVFCKSIVKKLVSSNKYEVHLVPHVISKDESSPENDVKASEELKSLFKECIIAPEFDTPVQAKSYICNMDVFLGARMHATIAAFSSNTATIPIAYSRKFAGLYENLGYNVIIDLTKIETNQAIKKTLEYIDDMESLKEMVIESNSFAKSKLDNFIRPMTNFINNI